MSGFVCTKSISLSGTQFLPGERIPAECVLPSRVLALKRSGYITEAETVEDPRPSKTPYNGENGSIPVEIPIITSEGILTATVSSRAVSTAFTIMQSTEKEAREILETVTDDDALMLVNAAEKRKGVLSAVRERHEFLTGDGDSNGKDL